jgi:hypothetical protein
MERCLEPGCKFVAKNRQGLIAHMRQTHGANRKPNRKALERTLSILRGLGRIEEVDAARVQAIRSIADSLDKDDSNAQMWRTYLEALDDLMRQDEDADDELARALAEIRGASPMGD